MAPPRARTLLLAALGLLAAACDDEPGAAARGVPPLEIPTEAERQAADAYAEAESLLAAGREKQAEPLLRRVVDLSPRHAKALAALSDIDLRRRRFDDAADLLRRLVAVAPDDQTARRKLVEALDGKRDYAGAEAVSRDWTRDARDNSDAWYALGCALHSQGKLEPAAQALKQAASLKASRADVRSRLGLVYLAQGKRADAEAAQRDAVTRDPRFGEAWLRLAEIVDAGGPARRAEAIDAYRRAVQADPARFAAAHAELYRLLRLAGRSDPSAAAEAETEWKVLLRVAGRDMLPWGGLGAPAPEAADPAKEERKLREAVEAKPGDSEARMRFAMFLHRQGDVVRAVDEYAEATLGDAADPRLRAALGAALLVKGDAETAEPQLREALRLDATDQTTWRNLGWALLQLGRDADAVAAFDEALKRFDGDRLARRARGLAKLHQGDLDGGRADLVAAKWLRG